MQQTDSEEREILVVEDDSYTNARRRRTAVGDEPSRSVTIRLHRVVDAGPQKLAEHTYRAGTIAKRSLGGKASLALELLDSSRSRSSAVVVAGSSYGSNRSFLKGVRERGFTVVAEVRPSELLVDGARGLRKADLRQLLRDANWKSFELTSPTTGKDVPFSAAKLSTAIAHPGLDGELFVAETGGIDGVHRGTIVGFASGAKLKLEELVDAVAWVRWIHPARRRSERQVTSAAGIFNASSTVHQARVVVRSNITLAERQDQRVQGNAADPPLRRALPGVVVPLRVAELFAGAGGMGLGFLLAGGTQRRFSIVASAEVNPIFTKTLELNHAVVRRTLGECVPEAVEPLDLRTRRAQETILGRAREAGGIHVLIGGPPCQGFSNANRNSWSSSNPNNQLVKVYLRYVEKLRPLVFVMENVQGILWTAKESSKSVPLSVVDYLAKRFRKAGYLVFPKLLDAVWYGAPQYRSRFFLVGIHKDLGYGAEDFGDWGPFPQPTHGPSVGVPYVTVRDAFGDLPSLRNGDGEATARYSEPDDEALASNAFLRYARAGAERGVITDHVTSKHADYVIERYRRIPPGGNWKDIIDTMSNYADVERTHSNIYRRLVWDAPSITIGHYRKSMLVHPSQHRGLSLREASRLQSFPDWFRFSGDTTGRDGGLVHKQQQLANAVCPLVTKAMAEFLLRL